MNDMKLQFYKVITELQRCEEELRFLRGDALRVVSYFSRQLREIESWLAHEASQASWGRRHLMHISNERLSYVLEKALAKFRQCGWLC